ncbi:hypothetical protein J2I47_14965 [Fibrella sp. HMF5335]|uniref:HEPN AbiJ-N-terminal domain-containing protein n=1 Tax=Fibrella rubiginis TaxID=2817060 RepID=A0A939GEW1_9BACT|nr:hypothetical protein [Fibrella rubiginis]MBO0937857.1 hypothetical protein [Fibrella rubiginis]
MTFSQRMGLKPVRSMIQRESADMALRNFLWNALSMFYFRKFRGPVVMTEKSTNALITKIWVRHYKARIDEIPYDAESITERLKIDFINGKWNEMFDILEFMPNNYNETDSYDDPINEINEQFFSFTNDTLKEHLSAYRFVGGMIIEITSEEEIASIEDTLKDTDTASLKPIYIHLRRALELFADRDNPDYRNSIKESVSSVESLSKVITQDPKATLGQALNEIEKKHELHPALKKSFSSLYGYTSDTDGIRHALLEESTLKQEDAKFMLVACSAFVNYLLVKTAES